jgi:hypothetical protein
MMGRSLHSWYLESPQQHHAGRVVGYIRSSTSQGATFQVTLSLTEEQPESEEAENGEAESEAPGDVRYPRLTEHGCWG